MMERIRLTRNEKKVLRLLDRGLGCPADFPQHIFTAGVRSLEMKGLARCLWSEAGSLVDSKVTKEGREYVAMNPSLRNPFDWKFALTTAIAMIAAAASVLALFIACSLLKGIAL